MYKNSKKSPYVNWTNLVNESSYPYYKFETIPPGLVGNNVLIKKGQDSFMRKSLIKFVIVND